MVKHVFWYNCFYFYDVNKAETYTNPNHRLYKHFLAPSASFANEYQHGCTKSKSDWVITMHVNNVFAFAATIIGE